MPDEFIAEVFRMMEELPRHTFQLLTKRIERAAAWPGPWPPHVWLGTSVESTKVAGRIEMLRRSGAAVKWISFEPLIASPGPLDLAGVSWCVAGGESGPRYRPMDMEWARQVRDACVLRGIPFFYKQDADLRPGMRPWLAERDGSRWIWRQFPGDLRPSERTDGMFLLVTEKTPDEEEEQE